MLTDAMDGYIPPLTDDEKRTLARWIDLGAPLDFSADYGWFADDVPPTLTVSQPRGGIVPAPVVAIRFGVADANSGVDEGRRSVTVQVRDRQWNVSRVDRRFRPDDAGWNTERLARLYPTHRGASV